MTAGEEDLARAINRDFDRLTATEKTVGHVQAVRAAHAAAFAAVAFLDQAAGRNSTLALICDLIDA